MGHRIPAQGANPGNLPGKRDLRSEGTPHSLRVSDIDHGLPSGVPSEHTYSRGCGSQGVALGWYALPLQGMWYDHSFRYRESRSHALTGHHIPAQGANPGNPPRKRDQRSEGTPHSLRVSDIGPGLPMRCSFRTHLFSGMRFPGRCPGLVCVTPSGYVVRSCFRYLSLDPMP